MNRSNISTKLKHYRNSSGILAIILMLFVTLSCSFDLGELGQKDRDAGDSNSSDRPTGKKKKKDKSDRKKKDSSDDEDDNGDFVAVYSAVSDSKYEAFDKSMRDQNILEDIADKLNDNLSLPSDVTITFRDCGVENAFYLPDKQLVTICYEFMDLFYKKFIAMGLSEEEANQRMFGATEFFFLHELGHCLIDVYDLPAVGREEDAVDQLSTYILMEDMSEGGAEAAIAGVMIFQAFAQNEQSSPQAFADEHSLNSQRYFNIACWMYGKDPQEYSDFVAKGILPEARARRCEGEYNQLAKSWERLVAPYKK